VTRIPASPGSSRWSAQGFFLATNWSANRVYPSRSDRFVRSGPSFGYSTILPSLLEVLVDLAEDTCQPLLVLVSVA